MPIEEAVFKRIANRLEGWKGGAFERLRKDKECMRRGYSTKLKGGATMKRLRLGLFLVSIAITLIFCSASMSRAEEKIIKVGVSAPLSGPAAAWGGSQFHGVDLAIDDLNAAGGITVKGATYKFKCVAYDDKYSPDVALQVINKLVYEDGVKFLVGPLGAAPALAVLPILTKNKVLSLGIAFDDRILGPR